MPVIVNETKKKSFEGKVTLGAGVRIAKSVEIGMAMKASDYDWLFIDTEHGPFNLETATQIATAALTQGITPIVRVASLDAHLSTRILDAGAQGIVLPHTENADEARELVSICKFPPEGHRSHGGGLPHAAFEAISSDDLLSAINREMFLVAMIETPEAGKKADEIAAVEGIDCLLIGTNDLSTGMGLAGQHDHPRVNLVYEQVLAACKKHGKVPGMGGSYAPEILERRIKEGMRFILSGSDLNFMIAGAKRQAEMIRGIEY
ncbi:MAG: aldolase/citrate lyase family protein [bacterium]